MIVVEGSDGSGKSTLIADLATTFSLPIAPRVVSKTTEAMVDLKEWTEHNVSMGWQPIIFDRHRLISEPIYGSVLRKGFEPGFDDVRWLHAMNTMFYQYCRPLIIYCVPPYPIVRANLQGDQDNLAVVHKIRRIYSLYTAKAACDSVTAGAFIYDYTMNKPETLYRGMEQALERMAHV
jgi:hypothetical protein